jgi:alcohol dehydrogenase
MYHVTHGLSNALVLPHVLKFNLPNAASLYGELAQSVGIGDKAADFIDALEVICVQSGIERRLRDVSIGDDAIDALATAAMDQTRLLVNNLREVTYADARAIYASAW